MSEALEEGEELVVGLIATGLSIERSNGVENPLLQLEVGIEIDDALDIAEKIEV